MRLLADESVDARITTALRDAGHDVVSIIEASPGVSDEDVVARAVAEQRLVLTEDKDFGRLAQASNAPGVVLVRFPTRARSSLAQTLVAFLNGTPVLQPGTVAVISPGQIRVQRGGRP